MFASPCQESLRKIGVEFGEFVSDSAKRIELLNENEKICELCLFLLRSVTPPLPSLFTTFIAGGCRVYLVDTPPVNVKHLRSVYRFAR